MSGNAKEYTSFDALLKKPARTKDITVASRDDSGEECSLEVRIKAVSSHEYDRLVAECPPTTQQKKDEAAFNIDKFAPRLLSACFVSPALTIEEATDLYTSPDWSAGEIGGLYMQCMRLCTEGFNIPTTASV